MTKKITLGKNGKNRPEIQWDIPWSFFYKIGSRGPTEIGSIEQGWYAQEDFSRTFKNIKSKAEKLEVVLGIV